MLPLVLAGIRLRLVQAAHRPIQYIAKTDLNDDSDPAAEYGGGGRSPTGYEGHR
jgi:hypothetical protein